MGIFICFYIRLQLQDKPNFESELLEILDLQLLEYPEKLQNELVQNIEFERGIAANNILKLNLFITFIGILTRIAVFLVGPPGCSKTLCMNLIKKSMQGVNSQNQFWKQYPQSRKALRQYSPGFSAEWGYAEGSTDCHSPFRLRRRS